MKNPSLSGELGASSGKLWKAMTSPLVALQKSVGIYGVYFVGLVTKNISTYVDLDKAMTERRQ